MQLTSSYSSARAWKANGMDAQQKIRQSELREKRERVYRFLEKHRLDGLWLARRDNFAWYTGGGENCVIEDPVGQASLLLTRTHSYLIADYVEAERLLAEELVGQNFELQTHPWYETDARANLLSELTHGLRIGADTPWPGFQLLDQAIARLRFVLTPSEQYRYRTLCHDASAIMQSIARSIVPGQTEREVAAEITRRCINVGITPSLLLVGADRRVLNDRHPLPRDNPIFNCASLMLVGARGGLQAALARLVAVGHLPADLDARHRAATHVEAAYIHATRPGVSLSDILEIGARAYAAEGYPDEWRVHIQGGIIGYAPREFNATPDADLVIEPFEAVAWLPGIGGAVSEDTFLVLPDCNDMLTNSHDWPMVEVQIEGATYYRPDILRL